MHAHAERVATWPVRRWLCQNDSKSSAGALEGPGDKLSARSAAKLELGASRGGFAARARVFELESIARAI